MATQAALVFAVEVSLSFDRATAAARACGRPAARRVLRASAPSTFAMRWLISRLGFFDAGRPEVEVALTTKTVLHDKLRGVAEQTVWPQHRFEWPDRVGLQMAIQRR